MSLRRLPGFAHLLRCLLSPAVAAAAALFSGGLASIGCDRDPSTLVETDQRDSRTGLTPEEEDEVLVRVGERAITLGQFAETLLRMDPYERLRYKSEERQKELLDEMIEVELLAQEAHRRGFDRDPEVRLRIKQALRDELLQDLERRVPGPETFSEREVRQYFEAHPNEFAEPLRHRVQVIEVGQEQLARSLIGQLEESDLGSGEAWAKLARAHSLRRDQLGEAEAPELAGDLGFVSAPGEARGANDEVPEAVREAVFSVEKVGQVAAEPAQVGERFFVVRLGGISPARNRSLEEAERTIRVELRRQKYLEMERDLEEELRKKYPVVLSWKASPNDASSKARPQAPEKGEGSAP